MAQQYPRVTVHLELTSTDLRAAYDERFDAPLWQMDERGPAFFTAMLRNIFSVDSGVDLNITRLDMKHDLVEHEQVAA